MAKTNKFVKTNVKTLNPKTIAPKTEDRKPVIRFYKVPSAEYSVKEDVIKAFGYVIEKQIAKGGFGTVFICNDIRKKIKVACKWMDLGTALNDPRLSDSKNELSVIEKVRHPYIVKLFCHFIVQDSGSNNLYIFMELANGGDLYKYIQKRGIPSESELKKYWAQILCGINHMHGYGIAHRDIKPQNVLLVESKRSISGDYLLQVTDFGLSCASQDGKLNGTVCGTPVFMAPELLDRQKYNAFSVDVWALGVTLYVMFTLEVPFDYDKPPAAQVVDMKNRNWKFPSKMTHTPSSTLTQYIASMLEPDTKQRVNILQLINHSWSKQEYIDAHRLSDQMKVEKK